MKFSIIIPSYNQYQYISQTFENIKILKEKALDQDIIIEVLLFDNCSDEQIQDVIKKYESFFDFIEIKKDNGQYDAINKGILKATGDYWTWLNTDDLIDIDGFFQLVSYLKKDSSIDYIYGAIKHIDSVGNTIRTIMPNHFSMDSLVNDDAGIYQPGSFFRKQFTDKMGLLAKYNCCFDYEYILRLLRNNAKIVCCEFTVSLFRIHDTSKTGKDTLVFVKEQLEISKKYGRKLFSKQTFIANLRLFKYRYLKN